MAAKRGILENKIHEILSGKLKVDANENIIKQFESHLADEDGTLRQSRLDHSFIDFLIGYTRTKQIKNARFRDLCAAFLRDECDLKIVLEKMVDRILGFDSVEKINDRNRFELRNECFLLYFVLTNYPKKDLSGADLTIPEPIQRAIANYQIAVLNSSLENVEAIVWALIGLERLIVHVGVDSDNSTLKILALGCFDRIKSLIEQFESLSSDNPELLDYNYMIRNQAIFCLKWFRNILQDFKLAEYPLKIVEKVSVKGNTVNANIFNYLFNDWTTTIASHAVQQGVHYFEASGIGDEIDLGYGNRNSDYRGIGIDRQSIGLKLSSLSIMHNCNNLASITSGESPKNEAVNVAGVLIDFTKRVVLFYVNGHRIPYRKDEFQFFHDEAYCPIISLGFQQHWTLNFGKGTFQYADTLPDEYQKAVISQKTDIGLLVPQFLSHGIYKNIYFDYPWTFPLYFGDAFSNWITMTEITFKIDREGCVTELSRLLSNPNSDKLIPFLKAILDTETFDEALFYYIWNCLFLGVLRGAKVVLQIKLAKIIELILPYAEQNEIHTNRNICFAILTVANLLQLNMSPFVKSFWEKLKPFWEKTFFECEDKQSRMLVILCMNKFALLNSEIKSELTTERVLQRLNLESTILSETEQVVDRENAVHYQLALCAKSFHQTLSNTPNGPTEHSKLGFNPAEINVGIKLSPNSLFARYDAPSEYGNVLTFAKFSTGVRSFKVTLLTNGPVRVGFVSATSILNQNIGLGDYKRSIAYCASEKAILHNNQQLQITSETYTSEVGDEIKAVIDFNKRKFEFYLNGDQIHFDDNAVDFVEDAYYLAITLEPFQQVYLQPDCNVEST